MMMHYHQIVEAASYTPRKRFLPILVRRFMAETGEANPIASETPAYPPDYDEFAPGAKKPSEVRYFDENHIELVQTEVARLSKRFVAWLSANGEWLAAHGWLLARESLGTIDLERIETDTERLRGFAYHVTLADRVPSILQNGLETRTSEEWGHSYTPRIYLVRRRRDAIFVMSKFADVDSAKRRPHRKYAILQVDLRQLPDHSFHVDPQTPGKGLYTLRPIPASALRVVR